ncbi:hypothetical protein B0T22DRAFT_501960 [Podospora appendiculata]|uniref:Uncharacterized protein n=1 Tax=Podospora appendiculata TaxID=314037 RepID=A0AAE0X169_9PEZI|nr:hypothetical protein B0T22DRAFT_501960 [Podospora appendiculata]
MDMADVLERLQRALKEAKEKLAQYLHKVQTEIFSVLKVEKNRANRAGDGVTDVGNKVYPHKLRRWTEFPLLHAGRFDAFAEAFGDSEIFPSLFEVETIKRDLLPTTRKNELDIWPLIRAYVEVPASKVLGAYLTRYPNPRCATFEFSNNAYGLSRDIKGMNKPAPATRSEDDQQPPTKRRSPERISSLDPDRWGIRVTQDNVRATALVAEYKAAHKARAEQHWLIVWIHASGDCILLLAILDTPGVLSFHFVPSSMDSEGLKPTADGTRCTPVAQLLTLALVGLEAENQPLQWIQKALADLPRWPSTKQTTGSQSKSITGPSLPPPPPPPPNDDDDDLQGGATEEPSSSSTGSGSKSASKDSESQPITKPQTGRTSLRDHFISKAQLCSIFRTQLAENLDCGCECLDKYLMFGSTGILFKITLPGYGYTLVTKGVQGVYADALVHEARVYNHCRDLQGVYIPVHLGNIDLVVPYPLQSLALVRHMMLMSWAGPHPRGVCAGRCRYRRRD